MKKQFLLLFYFFFFRNNFAAGWMNLGTIKAALHKEEVNFCFNMTLIIGSLSNQDDKGSRNFTTLTRRNGSFACFAPAFFLFVHFAGVLTLSAT